MGRKKQRTSQTSAGVHCQKRSFASKKQRIEYNKSLERVHNQLSAFQRGRNVVLTIPNPNTNETNKRFIKVNARDVWSGGGKQKKK